MHVRLIAGGVIGRHRCGLRWQGRRASALAVRDPLTLPWALGFVEPTEGYRSNRTKHASDRPGRSTGGPVPMDERSLSGRRILFMHPD